MESSMIRIVGIGHSLCLRRLLQESLNEECFTDVTLSSSLASNRTLRANKSVLAAASPFLNSILQEMNSNEEAAIIFSDYTFEDVAGLLRYIYTGQATCKTAVREMLEELQIGDCQRKVDIVPLTNADDVNNENEILTIDRVDYSSKSQIRKDARSKNCPLLPRKKKTVCVQRPVNARSSKVTMKDPLGAGTLHFCSGSMVEKSSIKYDVLPKPSAAPSDDIWDYPRIVDRIGIYFDPQLQCYYNGLIKSQVRERIYLHMEPDEDCNTEEDQRQVLIPSAVYHRRPSRRKNYESFVNSRLAVRTMCVVDGKTHLTLDGEPKINPLLKLVNYPKIDGDEDDDENDTTVVGEDVNGIIDEQLRRKRVLLSTLSRLKKEFSKGKMIAKDILRVSKKCVQESPNKPKATKKSQSLVVCEVCGKMISSSWIRVHKANHEGKKPYLCEHCGRSFASRNLLRSHVHYQHNSDLDYFTCSVCSKAFNKKSRLEIHMRIHNQVRPFECSTCGKKFHTNGNLRKHHATHTGDRPHKCHLCPKSFSQMTNLRLHLRIHQQLVDAGNEGVAVRKPEMIHRCDFCPMTFSRERHFYFHRCTHTGEQPSLPCSHCDSKLPNVCELKKHQLVEHPGTVHQCSLCEKCFFKKSAMQKHMSTHSQGFLPKPVFHCQHCNSHFTTAAAKVVHERTHTGERPFHCYHCEKSFTSKYNFRQHLRMHSDVRPYRCNKCSKAFRQPQHLKAHSFTHRAESNETGKSKMLVNESVEVPE